MVKKVSRRSQGVPDRRIIHPEREWLIGIGLFIAVVIAGSAYNAYVYNRLTNLQSEVVPAEQSTIRYRESLVMQALDTYRERAEAYTALQLSLPELEIIEPEVASSTATTTSASAGEVVDENQN